MWGALLARALTAVGVVVVVPDYRNYPFGTVPDMIKDVESAVVWTHDNIANYGGDPSSIVLVGQSAGGHLASLNILFRTLRFLDQTDNTSIVSTGSDVVSDHEDSSSDDVASSVHFDDEVRIKGFIALSSPLDLRELPPTFTRHGLGDDFVDRVFDGEEDKYSPCFLADKIVARMEYTDRTNTKLPPMVIYHGTADKTVPLKCSEMFVASISRALPSIRYRAYSGYSHTDSILEGPMDGDHFFHQCLFENVKEWTGDNQLQWLENRDMGSICPRGLIYMGRFINPF